MNNLHNIQIIHGNDNYDSSMQITNFACFCFKLQVKSLTFANVTSKPKKSGSGRFPDKVKNYLIAKFYECEPTGKKAGPVVVEAEMRRVRNAYGQRILVREEWLRATQIKGFFPDLLHLGESRCWIVLFVI